MEQVPRIQHRAVERLAVEGDQRARLAQLPRHHAKHGPLRGVVRHQVLLDDEADGRKVAHEIIGKCRGDFRQRHEIRG